MMEVTSVALEKLREVLDEQGEEEASLRVIAVPRPPWRGTVYDDDGEGDPERRYAYGVERRALSFRLRQQTLPGRGHSGLRGRTQSGRFRYQQPCLCRWWLWLWQRLLRLWQWRLWKPLIRLDDICIDHLDVWKSGKAPDYRGLCFILAILCCSVSSKRAIRLLPLLHGSPQRRWATVQ